MKKLILTIAHSSENPHTSSEYSLPLDKEASLAQCLERLRGALFLTGSATQSVRVIDADCGSEWIASAELLQRLNGPLFKWS
jgi:hypothetical protein